MRENQDSNRTTNTYTTGYTWRFGDGVSLFGVRFVTDNLTNVLLGTEMINAPNGLFKPYFPSELIAILGTPEGIWGIFFPPAIGSDSGKLIIVLLYNEGLQFIYDYTIPKNEFDTNTSLNYCFNREFSLATYRIVEPFQSVDPLDSLSPLQREWIFDDLESGSLRPIDELSGQTIEQFATIATSENPCLRISLP